jgi:hypothetical protein
MLSHGLNPEKYAMADKMDADSQLFQSVTATVLAGLDRWALDRAVRTKHAAVTGLRL